MKSDGGEGGIRTREKRKPLRDFQSRPFVHSGTSPRNKGNRYYRPMPPRPQALSRAIFRSRSPAAAGLR